MIIPVPKCLAIKKRLAQNPAFLPNAIGSPLAILLPSDLLAQPDIIGIKTPSAEVRSTMKIAPICSGML